MNSTDSQDLSNINNRTNAEVSRTDAEVNRTNAEVSRTDAPNQGTATANVVINMAQINIQNLVYENHSSYNNGHFIPVFQDELRALACNQHVKPGTLRVLIYILGMVDENNCFYEGMPEIAKNIDCSVDTVDRAFKQLIDMQIICKKAGGRERRIYELSEKVLNPRLAYKGNTRRLRKDQMPVILDPKTFATLIPSDFDTSDF